MGHIHDPEIGHIVLFVISLRNRAEIIIYKILFTLGVVLLVIINVKHIFFSPFYFTFPVSMSGTQ